MKMISRRKQEAFIHSFLHSLFVIVRDCCGFRGRCVPGYHIVHEASDALS